MSLMQFVGSLIAVTIVALIASRLFPSDRKLTKERVISNVIRYCPHIDLSGSNPLVFISVAGNTAALLFPDKQDGIALISLLGDRVVVRELKNLQDVKISKTYAGISFNIGDFTQPKIQMRMPECERETLLAAIKSQATQTTETAHA